jgi:hypothetical protein
MTEAFSLDSPFLGSYSERAKDIDNDDDNNNRFYERNTWQKKLLYKKQINHNRPMLIL